MLLPLPCRVSSAAEGVLATFSVRTHTMKRFTAHLPITSSASCCGANRFRAWCSVLLGGLVACAFTNDSQPQLHRSLLQRSALVLAKVLWGECGLGRARADRNLAICEQPKMGWNTAGHLL